MWEARRAQHTISSGKLTTFILEGVVDGVMVRRMVLCGLKSFLFVPEPSGQILTMMDACSAVAASYR